MVALVFNAQQFESQQLPEALPDVTPVHYPQEDIVLTPEQQSYIGCNSSFAGLGVLDTPAKVLQHCKLQAELKASQAAIAAQEQRKDPVYKQQQREQRAAQADTVAAAHAAWKEAVRQRNETVAQLTANIKTLHDAFVAARDAQ